MFNIFAYSMRICMRVCMYLLLRRQVMMMFEKTAILQNFQAGPAPAGNKLYGPCTA